MGDFRISIEDPPPCTVGFLPPSQWRSPADITTIDTPDGLYCKLPQDSPIVVRGARNYPCMGCPASARRRARSATATSRTSRWPCGSTPWPVSDRSESDRPGRPAGRPGRLRCRIFAPVEGDAAAAEAAIAPGPPGRRYRRARRGRSSATRCRSARRRRWRPCATGARRDGAAPVVHRCNGPARSLGGGRALRPADRSVRRPRWQGRSADRSRRPSEVVAGLDLQGGQ